MTLADNHARQCATLVSEFEMARIRGERIGLRKSTSNLFRQRVTRGKRLVVLVTDSRALPVALKQARRGERRSRLAERLRHEELRE